MEEEQKTLVDPFELEHGESHERASTQCLCYLMNDITNMFFMSL